MTVGFKEIYIDINCERIIRVSDRCIGGEGTFGFVRLVFNFINGWDGLDKSVIFKPEGKGLVVVDLDNEDSCIIPDGVNSYKGKVLYSFMGVGDGVRMMSESSYFNVLDSVD